MNIYVDQIDTIAARFPDRPYMQTLNGEATTFGEFHERVFGWAAQLHRWGVNQGDRVAMVVDNRPEFVVVWYACQVIGAIAVPLNPELTWRLPSVSAGAVGAGRLRVRAGARPHRVRGALATERIPVYDLEPNDGVERPGSRPRSRLGSRSRQCPARLPQPDHLHLRHNRATEGRHPDPAAGQWPGCPGQADRANADDRLLVASPMFHGLGQSWYQYSLTVGSRVVIAPRLSVSRFWDDARRCGVTAMQHVGATLSFLLSRPADPGDREHSIRFSFGIGAPKPVWEAFNERFQVDIVEFYGMTEIGMAMFTDQPSRVGSVGPLRAGSTSAS